MEIFQVKHLNLREETLVLLKAGWDTYLAAEERQLWSPLQTLLRKYMPTTLNCTFPLQKRKEKDML